MDFIKLTYQDDTAVYVNVDKIAMIDCEGECKEDNATKIYFTATSDGDFMRWIRVKETPEEIIRLIEQKQ